MTENQFSFRLYSILTLFLFFLALLNLLTPAQNEAIYRPLPNTKLKDESDHWIEITKEYPAQDYLLLFYVDTSSTSINQIIELSRIADQIPTTTTTILIHIGRPSRQLPVTKPSSFYNFSDPKAEFTRNTGVDIVPTLLYIKNDQLEVFYSEELLSSEEILSYLR